MADRIEEKGSRLRSAVRVAWLLALAAVFLAPAVRTGYWSEDLYQAIMPRGGEVIHRTSLLGEVLAHIKLTLTIGRFFPLTPALMTTVHYVFHGAWSYKAYIVATGVLDVFLFYCLARKLGGRRDYACFAACLTIGLIQYRVAVDPSLGFSGQIQLLIAGLFLCLLALQRHLKTRALAWLLASCLLYLACALLYETTYLLVLLPLVLILRARDPWARRAWTALPYFAVAGTCAIETFLVRWLFPSDAYWQKPSFDPGAVALAIAHQASAGLPLSYFAFDPLKIFPGPGRGGLLGWILDGRAALVALPAFGLSFVCLRKRGAGGEAPADHASGEIAWGTLTALGLILLILPTLATAISPYHRARISPGVGWIAALIEYYGVGLILSAGLWNLVAAAAGGGPRARWKCLAASALVGSLVGMTYRANLDVVRCFNAQYGSSLYRDTVGQSGGAHDEQRLLLESALAAGLMDDVPEGAVVQCAHLYPFWYDTTFSRFFYAAHAGKSFQTLPPWAGTGMPVSEGYRVRDVQEGPGASGYVVLARGVRGPELPETQPASGGFRLYVQHPDLARKATIPVPFQVEGVGGPVPRQHLQTLKSGSDWAIYSLETLEKPVAPESLKVVFGPPKDDTQAVAREPGRTVR